jgi:hypothetical protein
LDQPGLNFISGDLVVFKIKAFIFFVLISLALSALAWAQGDPLAPLTDGDLTAYVEYCKKLPELTDDNGEFLDPNSREEFFAGKGIGLERFVVLNERLSHVLFEIPLVQTKTISDADVSLIKAREEELKAAILQY